MASDMNIYAPDYYADFHCTADRCRHTCCEGWEIDIDEESLKRYLALPGSFGDRLRSGISQTETPHFILNHERCPLLNDNNLCDLILQCGEQALCQICADHPRFRNFWSGRVEVGLGMACEEAARLILSAGHPMKLVRLAGDGSERLDETEVWLMTVRQNLLDGIRDSGPPARLREYLIYRHIPDALYDNRLEERIAFVEKSCNLILHGWDGTSLSDLIERARQFSNEIEYDDEKLEIMIGGKRDFFSEPSEKESGKGEQ